MVGECRRRRRARLRGRPVRLPKALCGSAVAFRPTATNSCWDVVLMTDRLRTGNLRQSPKAAHA